MRRRVLLAAIVLAVAVTVTTVYALNVTISHRPTLIRNGNQTTIVAWANSTNNVPEGVELAKRVSNQDFSLELYLPPTPVKKGDPVIIHVIIRPETGEVDDCCGSITVTDSNGTVAYEGGFARTRPEPIRLGGRWEVTAVWDTGSSYKGVTPQIGTYLVQVTVGFNDLGARANLTLTN